MLPPCSRRICRHRRATSLACAFASTLSRIRCAASRQPGRQLFRHIDRHLRRQANPARLGPANWRRRAPRDGRLTARRRARPSTRPRRWSLCRYREKIPRQCQLFHTLRDTRPLTDFCRRDARGPTDRTPVKTSPDTCRELRKNRKTGISTTARSQARPGEFEPTP